MAAWDFADIYTRSPRALGVYISKIPRSHGITITYYGVGRSGGRSPILYVLTIYVGIQHSFTQTSDNFNPLAPNATIVALVLKAKLIHIKYAF